MAFDGCSCFFDITPQIALRFSKKNTHTLNYFFSHTDPFFELATEKCGCSQKKTAAEKYYIENTFRSRNFSFVTTLFLCRLCVMNVRGADGWYCLSGNFYSAIRKEWKCRGAEILLIYEFWGFFYRIVFQMFFKNDFLVLKKIVNISMPRW